jgi:hypothetical protein
MNGDVWHMVDVLIVVIPVGLALLALAVAWGSTLTRQRTMVKDITDLEDRVDNSDLVREGLKKEYMTEKQHVQLCLNNTLRFEAHVTKVVKQMGDTLLEKIEVIVNGEK